jgi:hypothetical protein
LNEERSKNDLKISRSGWKDIHLTGTGPMPVFALPAAFASGNSGVS